MQILKKLGSYLALAKAYTSLNWRIQMEYRGAFVSQFAAMFLNNSTWLAFWLLFFDRFPVVKGFGQTDVITLWAICAASYGLASTFFYNLQDLAVLIARGQLDTWMLYPRALLPHLALGKMSASSIGDLVFGYVIYLVLVRPDLPHLLMFILLTIAIGFLFIGFNLMRGSLAFFVGNAETLSEQWFFSMVTFSTYPSCLFDGWVKVALYTVIPAGFVAGLPVDALKHFSLIDAALTVAGCLGILTFGTICFYLGLTRYQSGNLIEMRS